MRLFASRRTLCEPRGRWLTRRASARCDGAPISCNRGIALRFPRFLRVRTDKKPEDATTTDQLVALFKSQNVRGGSGPVAAAAVHNDDDDDHIDDGGAGLR